MTDDVFVGMCLYDSVKFVCITEKLSWHPSTDDVVTLLHPNVRRKLRLGETIATQGIPIIFVLDYVHE